jgi:hypothetical protein
MRGLLASVVGLTLFKLTLRALSLSHATTETTAANATTTQQYHLMIARTLYALTCLRQLPNLESDNDARLAQCLLVLLYPQRYATVTQLYLDHTTRSAFADALNEIHKKRAAELAASVAQITQQEREQTLEHPDQLIRFRQLHALPSATRSPSLLHDFDNEDDFDGN